MNPSLNFLFVEIECSSFAQAVVYIFEGCIMACYV
jgi:hypothetical protein